MAGSKTGKRSVEEMLQGAIGAHQAQTVITDTWGNLIDILIILIIVSISMGNLL